MSSIRREFRWSRSLQLAVGLTLAVIVGEGIYLSLAAGRGQGTSPKHMHLPEGQWISFTTDYPPSYDIADFAFLSRFEYRRAFDNAEKKYSFTHAGKSYRYEWDGSKLSFRFFSGDNLLAELPLFEMLSKLKSSSASGAPEKVSQDKLTVEGQSPFGKVRMYVENISLLENGSQKEVYFLQSFIVVQDRSLSPSAPPK